MRPGATLGANKKGLCQKMVIFSREFIKEHEWDSGFGTHFVTELMELPI